MFATKVMQQPNQKLIQQEIWTESQTANQREQAYEQLKQLRTLTKFTNRT